ncbi:MAG: phosphoribosylformylglycinamidine cyclo-ligase [Bacillota bacterium]|nr:phosphoribosylformylglycinamidine cyclo-ligase [Bacillota bacterium]
MQGFTYRQAGVDVTAGYEAVRRIKALAASTFRPEVLGGVGSFGALVALPTAYRQPVLVSGADGVGTKVLVAQRAGRHNTVGLDCVAMCVNDVAALGAEPLFFLDYVALGKLEPALVAELVEGVAEGCRRAGCALVGGETAEMPGLYEPGEYDLAGFAVGVVERDGVIDGSRVQPGDALVGLASSGLHANGFSLVRKLVFEVGRYELDAVIPELGRPLGEELLIPTRIYARSLLALRRAVDVRGVAHITGGGFFENIPRGLPPGTSAVIERGSWPIPPIFPFLQRLGRVEEAEMFGTFNMGIGLLAAVPAGQAEEALAALAENGEQAWVVGRVAAGGGGVELR